MNFNTRNHVLTFKQDPGWDFICNISVPCIWPGSTWLCLWRVKTAQATGLEVYSLLINIINFTKLCRYVPRQYESLIWYNSKFAWFPFDFGFYTHIRNINAKWCFYNIEWVIFSKWWLTYEKLNHWGWMWYMRRLTRPSLIQTVAFRLLGSKSILDLMLAYC